MLDEEFGGVAGAVHDGANFLEALVNERNAVPLEHPVALHQANQVRRPLRHRPHDVGEQAAVRAALSSHHPEAETSRWKINFFWNFSTNIF